MLLLNMMSYTIFFTSSIFSHILFITIFNFFQVFSTFRNFFLLSFVLHTRDWGACVFVYNCYILSHWVFANSQEIHCKHCDEKYMGQTQKSIKTHHKEKFNIAHHVQHQQRSSKSTTLIHFEKEPNTYYPVIVFVNVIVIWLKCYCV